MAALENWDTRQCPSELVRNVLADALGCERAFEGAVATPRKSHMADVRVRVCLRMGHEDADFLRARAKRVGVPLGECVAMLVADASATECGLRPAEQRSALVASTAELATFSRNIGQLSALLRRGGVPAAPEYRAMLDPLVGDVRRHLALASGALADLQLRRGRSAEHPFAVAHMERAP
ncbi:hypothetical protein [Piscinibacter koreensis]|uniref:Uncharacterized protein n=1 Tax=Piscinibacter koreensis TaxID=2742824 RepID=A0A7Y6NT76_9BURK|nr:hypothetical protein [Schlegelella koreensis]NUZ08864.1 hypothetical protein [Schlegelella koreensis]